MAIGPIFKWVGRVVFLVLLATQCGFLAAYPAQYKDNSFWYFITASYVPAVMLWICLMCLDKADLRRFFCVWAVYICCALLPNVVVIFGSVVDNIEKERFLGPNVLKIVLCITPLLLLLLVNTADDSHSSERRREVVAKLSVDMAIDLFDGVEMLDIVLEDKEHKYGISEEFMIATITVACFSFFLSPLQMAQTKFTWGEPENTFSNSSDSQLCRNDCRQFSVFGHPCVDLYRIWKRRIYLHRQERHRNHSFLVGNLPSYSFALEVTFATLDYRVALLYSRKVVVTADSTLALAENSNIAVD